MQGSAHRQTSSLIPRRKGSFTSGSESHFVQALWQKPEIPQSLQSYHPGSFLVVQRFGLHTFTAMAWVQFLLEELRSLKLCSTANMKKKRKKKLVLHR